MLTVIDVSSHQASYATKGVDGVIVKATEGVSYTNPQHAAQVKQGRDAGLVVGHYHYVNGGSSMTAQADHFLQQAGAQNDEILVLDWEETAVSSDEKDDFLKYLKSKAGGRRVLLYCSQNFWLHRDTSSYAADGLWVAQYNGQPGKPAIKAQWVMHQYTSSPIDTSVAQFASRRAMAEWAGAPKPPAAKYEPYPGAAWFTMGRKSPIVAAMHTRLVAVGCNRYQSKANKNIIGSGDKASYEAWQRKYSKDHHKGWSGSALQWPPGKETWDALKVPKV